MNRMMRWTLASAALIVGALTVGSSAQVQTVTMRLHHSAPLVHQITLALHAFAQDVEARSNGEIDVDVVTRPRPVIPSSQFVTALTEGTIEAAAMPNFQWTTVIPEMNFSVIPYLSTDLAQIEAFPTSPAAEFLERKLNELEVRTLAWMHVTRTTVITSAERPIREPADLEGLRIRTLNDFSGVPFAEVSAIPGPLGAGRVYAAIEAGDLDAVMTDVSSSVGLRLDEVHKAATLAPYFSAFYHLFVSPAWLDDLAPRHRAAIEKAAADLVSTTVTITEARAAASVDVLRARGVSLHVQTDAERRAWIEAMQQPTIDAFEREVPGGGAFLALLPKE